MAPQRKTRCIDKRTSFAPWKFRRHCLSPGLNLTKYFEGPIEESRGGKFPYSFEYPTPLTRECIPLKRAWKDIGTDIVERSMKYHKVLKTLKERMKCNKKLGRLWGVRLRQRKLYTNGEGPFNIYPVELIEYAKQLELNPEPEFTGGYNWYLTGGSLCVTQYDDKNYIIRPYGEGLNQLDITPMKKNGTRLSSSKTNQLDLSDGGAINEICVKSFDDDLLIAVRNKNNIGILRYESDPNPVLTNYESKVPYVSCDLSPDSHLATTNTDKQMRIFDIETCKTRNKFNLEYVASLTTNNWSCVKYFRPDCYLYGDRRNLRPIDTRTKVIGSRFDVTDYGEICDFMSCMAMSQRYEHLVYVGTHHKLLAIDLRNFSGVIDSQNMTLSWTHMMNVPPSMIKTTVIDDGELVAVSSNLYGDMRVVLTEYGTEYKNLYLPVRPPSVLDSLQVAKDNFVCLDPISSVNRRARLCVTGFDFISTIKGYPSIISQNSICDLFKQNVTKEKQDDVTGVCEAMKKWMETVDESEECVPETKEFGATAVIYKKDMVRVLKSTRLTRPNVLEEEVEAAKPKPRPRWQRSIAELAKYKDCLVESIMNVWDFPIEEEEVLPLPKEVPEPLESKIRSWFEKSEFHFDEEPMEEDHTLEPKERVSSPLKAETIDISYTQFAGEFEFIQTSTQAVVPQVMPTPDENVPPKAPVRAKPTSKKKKHVMGF